jgi:hypothetical protein
MNKKSLIIIAIIAVIAALGAWLYYQRKTIVPVTTNDQPIEITDDTTDSINRTLDGIVVQDIDNDLSEIDKSIKEL